MRGKLRERERGNRLLTAMTVHAMYSTIADSNASHSLPSTIGPNTSLHSLHAGHISSSAYCKKDGRLCKVSSKGGQHHLFDHGVPAEPGAVADAAGVADVEFGEEGAPYALCAWISLGQL